MASSLITEIDRCDIGDPSICATASITNVRHLSSYNWIDSSIATIAVPGSPPLWSAPKTSKQLQKDKGFYYINQNQARHPDSPLEPLFRALYIENPSFDINSVDVVTDRNNIRKLLGFINPDLDPSDLKPFTIGVEVIGRTALFRRDVTAPTEYIRSDEFRGFGHEFEKKFTIEQVNNSTGHHRIIAYQLGGLSLIVRYEADGYVATDPDNTDIPKAASSQDSHLLDIMRGLSLSSATNDSDVETIPSKLVTRVEGRVVPSGSIIEIKTRSISRELSTKDVAAQLWVSQTSKLVKAYHSRGEFQVPQVEDVEADVKKWEELNQNDIKRLVILLKTISNLAAQSDGKVTVKYEGGSKLLFYQANEGDMLPHFLYSKWEVRGVGQAKKVVSVPEERKASDAPRRDGKDSTEMARAKYGDGSY